MSAVTGVARSTIGRGLAELGHDKDQIPGHIRRPGGGRKPKIETESGLLDGLSDPVQSAIRGDPEAALLWVSRSQRHLARALAERSLSVGQKLVGRLLKRLLGKVAPLRCLRHPCQRRLDQPWDHQRHGGLCRGEHPALVA